MTTSTRASNTTRPRLLNLPNVLTGIRIAVIPVFVFVFFLERSWSGPVAAGLFLLAALTDWLDGYLARRLGQTSAFGAFLDPVADKLIVAIALVLIVAAHEGERGVLVALSAAIIIGREITISALREWMAEMGARHHVKVSRLGKFKTVMQMTALAMMLYQRPIGDVPIYDLGIICLVGAALLTLWSMVVYLRAAWPHLSEG